MSYQTGAVVDGAMAFVRQLPLLYALNEFAILAVVHVDLLALVFVDVVVAHGLGRGHVDVLDLAKELRTELTGRVPMNPHIFKGLPFSTIAVLVLHAVV